MKLPPPVGQCVSLIPTGAVAAAARPVFHAVLKRYPALLERLDAHLCKVFAFRPTDLPLAFVVRPSVPSLEVVRPGVPVSADAAVCGPIFVLLALLEGRLDGDAMFFSRDLTVSGDMEAVLALRNALDGCDLDLPRDVGAVAGPFGPILTRICETARAHVLGPDGAANWN